METTFFKSKKVRLLPTPKQEELFRKSAGVARWAYNYFLAENEKVYQEYLQNNKTGTKYLSEGTVRKYITNTLKPTTHKWLSEISNNVVKQAIKDANKALQWYHKGTTGRPTFKSRHKSKPSFYVNYESLKRTKNGFQGEKLGTVKTSEPLPKVKGHYLDPHITYDGKYWYLSVSYEVQPQKVELTNESIGIDLGVKELAVVSTGKVYKNINKTAKVKKLKRRLKREQHKASRKIEGNIKNRDSKRRPTWKRPLAECKNIQRQNQKIKLIYKKLTDIRNNYLHQTTTEIVKTKPSRIVMENLNVKSMMKNRYLSKAIAEQKFYEFKRQIQYKCKIYGIEFVEADRFYASSKTCSHCGHKKIDLKLSDRIYKCTECGLVIDRDLNAAINLANYSI